MAPELPRELTLHGWREEKCFFPYLFLTSNSVAVLCSHLQDLDHPEGGKVEVVVVGAPVFGELTKKEFGKSSKNGFSPFIFLL